MPVTPLPEVRFLSLALTTKGETYGGALGFLEQILAFLEKNQILLTAFGLGGAGTIIMWVKGIPQIIMEFLKRELTTEMTVSNQNNIFYDILILVEKLYRNKNLRKWKLTNGRWGSDKIIFSMGYGTHWLWYRRHLLRVTLVKESANQTNLEKDSLVFSILGRGHKVFEKLVADADTSLSSDAYGRIYKLGEGYWSFVKEQRKRTLDSVFIEKEKREFLLARLQKFLGEESWYLQHGIPYQLGILLYGPPGTGKTSLIRALASYLDYPIYYLPVTKLSKLEDATASLPEKSVMVIEDIDSNYSTTSRRSDRPKVAKGKDDDNDDNNEEEEMLESFGRMSLSEILNALDGIFSSHGRILIATTNHFESLDQAIVRPGRFDIKLEIGYVNNEILKLFLDSFFPDNSHDTSKMTIRKNLTIADLQNYILCGMDIDTIVGKACLRLP